MTEHRTARARAWTSLAAATLAALALAGCGSGAATVEGAPPAALATGTPRAQETTAPSAAESPSKAAESKKAAAAAKKEKQAAKGTALALLETIPVKGRAPKTGYDRDEFGSGWQDPDRNGCDARNDILARDLTGETFRPGTNNCIVTSGTLADPFTATTIHFVRGNATSTAVQIDHVVPLSDAWQKGAR
ncbi:HNH endonuclease family protein, partial [Arthrobacter mobilis]|uniref:HNH endonuclease family protein n=1 Tax=Arthrobacter mobilis TaxID=2724944 RepID=UPI001FE93B8E